jgi:hypothetical protein
MAEPNNNGMILPTGPEYHSDRDLLINRVQRRPAMRIGPTAVTQHLVYWIPDHLVSRRDAWVADIDAFLVNLKQHLEQQEIENTAPKFWPLGEGSDRRYQAASLAFEWQGMPVAIAVELRHEYFTLTTAIDLSRAKDPGVPQTPQSTAQAVSSALQTINDVGNDHYRKPSKGDDPRTIEQEKGFGDSGERLHIGVWREFFKDILASPLAKQKKDAALEAVALAEERKKGEPLTEQERAAAFNEGASSLGRALIDFRGLVVSRPDAASKFKREFIMPFGHAAPAKLDAPPKPFSPKEGFRLAHAIAPLVASGVPGIPPVVCNVFDGSCLYASALGARPLEEADADKPLIEQADADKPLTYMVVSQHGNAAEAGLLPALLHNLGTARIAALYHLQRLSIAGKRLSAMEEGRKLENIGQELHDASEDHDKRGKAIQNAAKDLFDVLAELRAIRKGDRLKGDAREEDATISGGLPYRAGYRSRYYQEQFDYLVKLVRIGERIKGFRPYDEAVRARLGDAFNFISTLAIRYEQMEKKAEAINQQLQTVEALHLQEEIRRQTAASATYQGTISEIQRAGEIFLGLGLFPAAIDVIAARMFGEHTEIVTLATILAIVGGTGYALRREIGHGWNLAKKITVAAVKIARQPPTAMRHVKEKTRQEVKRLWDNCVGNITERVLTAPTNLLNRIRELRPRRGST